MDSANAIEIEGEPLSAFSVTPMDVIIYHKRRCLCDFFSVPARS
jgi:hypothetical protein